MWQKPLCYTTTLIETNKKKNKFLLNLLRFITIILEKKNEIQKWKYLEL